MAMANITVEVFALAVTLLLLLCSGLDKSRKDGIRWLLRSIIIANAALLLSCIVTWLLEGKAEYETLNTVMTAFAGGLGFPMAAFYTEYVVCTVGEHAARPTRFARVIEGVCVLAFVLNFVSIFNGMYFSCPGGVYTRGPLFLLNQSFSAIILLPNACLILKHRRALGSQETVGLLSFAALPLLVALTQFAFSGITAMCLATTLTVVMIYVSAYLRRGWKLMEQERELTEKQIRAAKLEAELTDSRVSVMLSQIQPHFLYNALSSISALCELDPAAAQRAVMSFSKYLRWNLDSLSRKSLVLFRDELTHVRQYLTLEFFRFDNIRVDYDLGATDFMIPPLTLQPIVENAVRYGILKRKGGGTVTIASRDKGEHYQITVQDDGVGFDTSAVPDAGRSHVGIENVRSRLQSMCGGTLTVESMPDVGTIVTYIIPKGGKVT